MIQCRSYLSSTGSKLSGSFGRKQELAGPKSRNMAAKPELSCPPGGELTWNTLPPVSGKTWAGISQEYIVRAGGLATLFHNLNTHGCGIRNPESRYQVQDMQHPTDCRDNSMGKNLKRRETRLDHFNAKVYFNKAKLNIERYVSPCPCGSYIPVHRLCCTVYILYSAWYSADSQTRHLHLSTPCPGHVPHTAASTKPPALYSTPPTSPPTGKRFNSVWAWSARLCTASSHSVSDV